MLHKLKLLISKILRRKVDPITFQSPDRDPRMSLTLEDMKKLWK
jgi:hypothetical protein